MNQWVAVDDYINDRLIGEDDILDAALNASETAGLPPISVAANQGKLLHLYARMLGARRILEFGTLGGYSTIWLARALPEDGELVSLEIDPHHAEVARHSLTQAGVADLVTVIVGPALKSVTTLKGPFDLVFIDADKPNYPNYFSAALQLSKPGSVIIVDNAVRGGLITDPSNQDPNVVGTRQLYDLISADPRVSATAVQTVGVKGYDGFVLARVN